VIYENAQAASCEVLTREESVLLVQQTVYHIRIMLEFELWKDSLEVLIIKLRGYWSDTALVTVQTVWSTCLVNICYLFCL